MVRHVNLNFSRNCRHWCSPHFSMFYYNIGRVLRQWRGEQARNLSLVSDDNSSPPELLALKHRNTNQTASPCRKGMNLTKDNSEVQQLNGRLMVNVIKNIITIIFAYINWSNIQVALGRHESLGAWFTPMFFICIFIPIGYFIFRSIRLSREQGKGEKAFKVQYVVYLCGIFLILHGYFGSPNAYFRAFYAGIIVVQRCFHYLASF